MVTIRCEYNVITGSARRSPQSSVTRGAQHPVSLIMTVLISFFQLDRILGRYGTFIIERAGSDVDQAMETLTPWRDNIYLVRQTIQNDVSSTKVRLFLKRGMSVRYLLPNPVVDYIEANGLYLDDGPNSSAPPAPSSTADSSSQAVQQALSGPAAS